MQYICILFSQDKYYMELNDDNIALREIILHVDTSTFEISCFDDCLAEGEVDIHQIEGEILIISKEQFDNIWQTYTIRHRPKWNKIKDYMNVGKQLKMKECYIYPQGTILKMGDLTGVCKSTINFQLNQIVPVVITGYDNLNMWLIVEKL